MSRFWEVLDEGDPVLMIQIKENGIEEELGLLDRDHAIRMIKMNSQQYYYKEVDRRSEESILIDKVLSDAQENYISPTRATPDDYEQALYKAKRLGLVKKVSKDSYDLTEEGQRAYEMGGFDNWKTDRESDSQQKPSITVHGPAVIGNNNTGNTQGRDFLTSESPIKKNSPQQSQPNEKPSSKTDHPIWDKIKYISVIIGGIGAVAALIAKCT